MKSLNSYSRNNLAFINSIQSRIENPIQYGALNLIKEHGVQMDSIMNKLNLYAYRVKNNNYILESDQDVLLDIEEQYTVRDIFVNICNEYEAALYRDFCTENNIDVEININEGIKDTFANISKFVKDKADTLKDKLKEVSDKVKQVKEFLAELLQKGVKSIKDLLGKFEELMIKISESLKSLIDKLTQNNADSYKDAFLDGSKNALAEELKTKEISKQYEALQNKILSGEIISESQLYEANEYDDAVDATAKKKKLKDNVFVKILLQIAIHWVLTKGVALFLTIAVPGIGPALATIYLPVANLVWASVSAFKTIKQIWKDVFMTDNFKNLSTGKKISTAVLWLVSLGLIAYSAMGIVGEFKGIVKHFMNGGALENLIPSQTVVELANKVNDLWEKLSGSSIKTVQDMNAHIVELGGMGIGNQVNTETSETIERTTIGDDGKELCKEFGKQNFNGDSMNGVEFMKNHGLSQEAINELKPDDVVTVFADGKWAPGVNKWSTAVDSATNGAVQVEDGFNKLLNTAHSNAGSVSVLKMKYSDYLKLAEEGIMGNNNHNAIIGAVKSTVETSVKNTVTYFAANLGFSGLMPIVDKYMDGGFKVRLGSNRTGSHLYNIPDKSWVKSIPYNKFIQTCMQLNPKAIAEMKKYIDDNLQEAEAYKKELEGKESLSKEEKKRLKNINKYLEKFKEGKSEISVLVFCTDDEYANMGDKDEPKQNDDNSEEKTNESLDIDTLMLNEGLFDIFKKKDKKEEESTEEKSEEKESKENKDSNKSEGKQYPVFFFNPITLCGGDLTRRTKTKGPRSHIYLAKGLLSRLEFIPVDGGMSGKRIVEMFAKFMRESLEASFEMTPDSPCVRTDGKKWVVNKDSKKTGERMDFGGFTNEQITTFMNNPDKVSDFLGGQHATDTISGGKHKYIEQDDTEEKKKHNEEVKRQFADLLSNNDELKKFVEDKCNTVYRVLYDKNGNLKEDEFEKLVPSLMRIENTYLNGENKNGVIKRIKNFFKKEDIDVDPSEIKKLSLKVASMRKKLKKQRYEEGLDDNNYNDIILEANIEILEEEFEILWENN